MSGSGGGGALAVGTFFQGAAGLVASKEERNQMLDNAQALEERAEAVREQARINKQRRKQQFQKLTGEQLNKRSTLDESTMESIHVETDRRMTEELLEIHRIAEMEALAAEHEARSARRAEKNQKDMEPFMLFGAAAKGYGQASSGAGAAKTKSNSSSDASLLDSSYGSAYAGHKAGNKFQK